MKLISWNVNGFRACLQKGFAEFFEDSGVDAFCIQETKMQEGQADFAPLGYRTYFNSAIKKGYSGTAVFCKEEPLSLSLGISGEHLDEGRVMTLEFGKYFLVNCYSPNSQPELARLDYRMQFDDALCSHLCALSKKKPTVLCGDLNVAHEEIDLKNPKPNIGSAGFSYEERAKFTDLLSAGFTDSFRHLYPDRAGAYSWWSYRFKARANNAGWRIDYFVVSNDAKSLIRESSIYADIEGSDHCPIGLEIEL
ncbi:MAG: exodeoxyribonuclease III [Oscillospiraceae bacterium]